MKTLWVVSGGAEAVPGIQYAKEMGLHVVVSDSDPCAPGFKYADQSVIASTYDVASSVAAAQNFHKNVRRIDGVISIAADVPLTTAHLTAALGLPGISVATAKLASDKVAMKENFAEKGIPIPWFQPVDSATHLKKITSERGFPLIIKPVDSRGARGVLKLSAEVDLDWAFQHALTFSASSRVMVEEYLSGPQISTESIFLDGVGFTPGFSDRNYDYLERFSPFVIENGGQQPSELSAEEQNSVKKLAEQAALAMGITNGTAKGDLVLTPEGPKVIEMAARLSGGWFCTDQIPVATGVDFLGAAIRLAIGEKVMAEELVPRDQQGVAIRYLFPEPGKIKMIKGVEEFDSVPWVHRLDFFLGPGQMVEPVTNHTKRTGFVITTGDSREQAVERAELFVKTVEVETVPLIKYEFSASSAKSSSLISE